MSKDSAICVAERLIGHQTGKLALDLSPRLSQNYTAAVGENNPVFFDDRIPDAMIAHPLLAAVLPQRLAMSLPQRLADLAGLDPNVFREVFHYDSAITYQRLFPLCGVLDLRETLTAVTPKKTGTYLVLRYEARHNDALVCRTDMGLLLRGVHANPQAIPEQSTAPEAAAPLLRSAIKVAHALPYVYDACTDVVHPIHTSRAVALAAGLPNVLLQGTATVALAVREIFRHGMNMDFRHLAMLHNDFRAPVLAGTSITVELLADWQEQQQRRLHFRVMTEDGQAAIRKGVLTLAGAALP